MDIKVVIDGLKAFIFFEEDRRLTDTLRGLIKDHAAMGRCSHGFRYGGQTFTFLPKQYWKQVEWDLLHPSLAPRMDALLEWGRVLVTDKFRVQQILVVILRGCQTEQDLRDALPNSLKDAFSTTRDLPRTRPEAYTIVDNPIAMKQYQELREKIEFYNISKLLF